MKNEKLQHPFRKIRPCPFSSAALFILFFFLLTIFQISKAAIRTPNPKLESPLEGRYDLTLHNSGKTYPAWLEVQHSGLRTLVGRYVASGGSARPISVIHFTDGIVDFSIPPQWDTSSNDLQFHGIFQGDSLVGTIIESNGKEFSFVGVRAPSLWRKTEPVWGEQIKLFDGKDLKGWHTSGKNQWVAEDGIMRSPASGSNIMTDQLFNDFKLHIEFRYPKESNSGVYLRGRYEVQIVDSKGKEPTRDYLGAIYGFLPPTEMMAKDAGEWQSYDVTLVGRMVTLVVNGKMVICDQIIPGITGGAMDSNEGEPGPIMIQGDHGPIDFRNILITPAK
jgi:Domain of Unknown Function (DUF1080)